jgi:hypothetical protein
LIRDVGGGLGTLAGGDKMTPSTALGITLAMVVTITTCPHTHTSNI